MKNLLSLLVIAIGTCLPLACGSAVLYQVADIGIADVAGINDYGVAAGTRTHSGLNSAFAWSAGAGFVYFSPLSGYDQSYASAINDQGRIVGCSASSKPHIHRACLWEDGKPVIDIGALPSGVYSPSSHADDINNAGQVVGSSRSTNGQSHAFLWTESAGIEDLAGAADAHSSYGIAINNNGVVVGIRDSPFFLWTRATGMREISVPAAGKSTQPNDINDLGQVVLVEASLAGAGPAYVWQDGHDLIQVGMLPGGGSTAYCWAWAINNLGQVVGQSNGQPFVWDVTNGIQPLPQPTGFRYGSGGCINDKGVIAGSAFDSQGNTHMLLWTPIPEPSSVLALLAGLAGSGAVIRRRGVR